MSPVRQLLVATLLLAVLGQQLIAVHCNYVPQPIDDGHANRTFRVDPALPQFLKDDQPFRWVGGSFHYFRALPQTWQRKLRTMRAAGLQVVTTYVEWALHNPHDGEYRWEGMADLVRFVQLAQAEDLLVVLRPGPYICAERDMGGFPYWLLTKYPAIKLRTMDPDYLREVQHWYDQLMPRLTHLLYANGGPIIMVQVENEYGSYRCDPIFRAWMRNETARHIGTAAVLFTNDGPSQTRCGHIPGVLATLDFGTGSAAQTAANWAELRKYNPHGPLVNAEYYPGWLTHWQERMQRVGTAPIVSTLRNMLQLGASVNFYMFYGGTNFGFTAGANKQGAGGYAADLTSYDYDAPMDEAGDPTAKFHALRAAIGEFVPLPDVPVPEPLPKMRLAGPVLLSPVTPLLSALARKHLATGSRESKTPAVTFEALNQFSGYVLYETQLPQRFRADPARLNVSGLHDRAVVMVDQLVVGVLSRENGLASLGIGAGVGAGGRLQLLVENQGRINYAVMEDFKGILGDVWLNDVPLRNWQITGYPLERTEVLAALVEEASGAPGGLELPEVHGQRQFRQGPTVYYGTFELDSDAEIHDTYLDPSGWGKGSAFVNGFNVGRYWPVVGPQVTLYVPRELLHAGRNNVTLVELESSAAGGALAFVDKPSLDAWSLDG